MNCLKSRRHKILPLFNALGVIFLVCLLRPSAIKAAGCEIGAFAGNEDKRAPYASEITHVENLMGRHINSSLVYWAWNDGPFPAADLQSGVRYHDGFDTQTVLHLTWEPWSREGASDDSYSLSSIAAGIHDSYITQFARDCRDWSEPIRLRFAHEMIDDNNPTTTGWYPWQDRPAEYVQSWNRVHSIFRDEGAHNVEFVWAPNHHSNQLSVLQQYYPGEDKVDWLGMDGYNFGYYSEEFPWGYWLTFDEIFAQLYDVLVSHPEVFGEDKKMMLAEFASAEKSQVVGKTKAEWVLDAFSKIKNDYSKISAFYWFHMDKERDFRIDSSEETLAAFRLAMEDPYFTSHVIPEPSVLFTFAAGTGFLLGAGKRRKKSGKS